MFRRSITVREVTKHLGTVVDELLQKHGQVTSEEFEKELEERTGIHWKQVKNYRNNPDQDQVIRPNSKIKTFIYENRRRAFFLTLRSRRTIISAIGSVTILLGGYQFAVKPLLQRKPIEAQTGERPPEPEPSPAPAKQKSQTVAKFIVPGISVPFQLGKLTGKMKALNWDKYYSQSGNYRRLDMNAPAGNPPRYLLVRLTYNLDTNDITSIEIQACAPDVVANLKRQIEEQTRKGFTYDKEDQSWNSESEFITTGTIFDIIGRGPPYDRFVVSLTAKSQ